MNSDWEKDFSQFYSDMGPIPDHMNGLERRDKTKDFDKFNCFWTYKNSGRPDSHGQPCKPRTKTSKYKNPVTLCICLEKDLLDYIKRAALMLSNEKGERVEANHLIRQALYKAFPLPSEVDMFGGKK